MGRTQFSDAEPSPLWKPILLTILGFTLLNLTVAYLVARGMGVGAVELPAVAVLLIAAGGVVALSVALFQWRAFLSRARLKGGNPGGL